MSERYPGGIISKTPPTVTGPATSGLTPGEGGSASGVWTLADVLTNRKIGTWPTPVLPRSLYGFGGGSVGDGTVASRSSPVQIGSLTNWAQVSPGVFNFASSIKTDGTLWTWGYNQYAQLGQNDRVARSSPVQVGSLTNWAQVSAGFGHVASVKADGTLWTWGFNNAGMLGLNTVINRSSPVQVGALTDWSRVSAGRSNTAAIKVNGTLWTWGSNTTNQGGQLGDGTTIGKSSPIQVGSLTNWAQVSSGYSSTASVKIDGTLWMWGQNLYGQLGQNNTINRSSPVQVGALTNWAQVSTGRSDTASVKTDGTLWTWGKNQSGALGINTTGYKSSPVQVGALTNWSRVSVGTSFCSAVKTDGTLWAWGNNPGGQLGQGDTISRSSPVQVGALTNWSQAASNGNQTFAITKG